MVIMCDIGVLLGWWGGVINFGVGVWFIAVTECVLCFSTMCAVLYGVLGLCAVSCWFLVGFILVVCSISIFCGVNLLSFILGGQLAPPICNLKCGCSMFLLAVIPGCSE